VPLDWASFREHIDGFGSLALEPIRIRYCKMQSPPLRNCILQFTGAGESPKLELLKANRIISTTAQVWLKESRQIFREKPRPPLIQMFAQGSRGKHKELRNKPES
jgi:hypothetical protein